MSRRQAAASLAALLLVGCTTLPSGPRTRVMPAPNKPFEVFVHDDELCRGFAARQIGTEPRQAALDSAVTSAAVGTAIGAVAGAALGGGRGAGVGAASGLVIGSAAGAGAADASSWELQRRYDLAYEQCMYAHGNQVPGYARITNTPPPPPPVRR
jgi:hypothetical protein